VVVVVEVKRALQGARRRYKAVQMTSICLLVADGECMGRADVIESAGPPLEVGVVGVELASNQDVAPSGAQIVAAAQASALWAGMLIPPGKEAGTEPLKRSSSTVTKLSSTQKRPQPARANVMGS
jgi:hypothetical protein